MKKINTLQKGSVRTIVFKEDGVWYATGLEFNIVTDGDTPEIALYNLNQAMRGYVLSAKKSKIRTVGILNQKTDPEYEALWEKLENNKKVSSPYQQIYSFGRQLTY
jgi:predicted RNase H-like HicB family nuclease